MPQIEIVSHSLCPHAHRLVLIATAKGWHRDSDYKVTYLPYATLGDTLPLHSPTGQLPVLKIDGAVRTSDSVHAAEYLDGSTGLGLIPTDPEVRLKVRERETNVGLLLDTMRSMFAGQSREAVQIAIGSVFKHLDAFDADLSSDGTTEQTMRMDMAALEPALALLAFFPVIREHNRWERIPRLRGILDRSMQNPWIKESMCPNYAFEFEEFFKMTNSFFPKAFTASL